MKSEDRVFPQVTKGDKNAGITVRDYIAIQAMRGIIAKRGVTEDRDDTVKLAYDLADEMIQESENGRG